MLNHLRGTHEENPEPYKKYNENSPIIFLGNGCASNIHFNWPVPSVIVCGAPDFCWDFWAGAGSSDFSLLLLLLLPAPALEPPPNPHLSFPSWFFYIKKEKRKFSPKKMDKSAYFEPDFVAKGEAADLLQFYKKYFERVKSENFCFSHVSAPLVGLQASFHDLNCIYEIIRNSHNI